MALPQHSGLPQHYLKPGESYYTERPVVVTTVLGSCVTVTFFHRFSRSAAICHALHPRCPRAEVCHELCDVAGRYATCAIAAMGRWMTRRGVRPAQIEVKMFGGAAMMGQQPGRADPQGIGRLNVQAAMAALDRMGLTPKVVDVGGARGRKILFDTSSGEVWLKRLMQGPPAPEMEI